jgi:hypothetical protein
MERRLRCLARITKLTDASTPRTNGSGLHHYASGPVQISREWGDGYHTINVTAAGDDYLVDYRRGGTLSNWRRAPFIGPDLSFGFSFHPDTPRIAYYVRDSVLQRYDTEKMALANIGAFPKSFGSLGSDTLVWLQYDKNDAWFVMMMQNRGTVIAWNSQTNKTLTLRVEGLDEPHLDRDGRYVFICRDSDWLLWDLHTDTTRGPYKSPFRGHPGAFRSLFAASDGNDNPATLWRHDPKTQINTTLYTGEQAGNGGQHRGDQWVMTDRELEGDKTKQWFLQSVHDEGEAIAGQWTQYQAMPKATISPDGKLIVFSSNMNHSEGRVDVFAVEVSLH